MLGSLLLNDRQLRDFGYRLIMKPQIHFLWQEENLTEQLNILLKNENKRMRIAYNGYKLSLNCFGKTPTMEWRLFYRYIKDFDFNDYDDITIISKLEKKENIHWPSDPKNLFFIEIK
tara:strand:- start:247 stop:597 length:351 start_codon:yes stop_codon:yes gene_type:complete